MNIFFCFGYRCYFYNDSFRCLDMVVVLNENENLSIYIIFINMISLKSVLAYTLSISLIIVYTFDLFGGDGL